LEILTRKFEESTNVEKEPRYDLFVLFSFTHSEIYITTSEGIAFEVCSEKKVKQAIGKASC